jgi:cobalt-zinc-cadmium efflux system outer membrane protein
MKTSWLLAIAMACAGVVRADEVAFLPDPAAAIAAIDALPEVQAARARHEAALARGEALARGNHGLELALMPTARHETRGTTYSEWEASLSRKLRLPRKAHLDVALGSAESETSALGIEDARHAGARMLLDSWLTWVRAAALTRLAERQLEVASDELMSARRRERAGDLAVLDRERADAAAAQARASVARARYEREQARVALAERFSAVTLPPQVPTIPPPPELTATREEMVSGILAQSHEVEIARKRAEQQALAAERADAERLPDPTLGVRVLDEARGREQAVGLVLTIPFAPGGAGATAQAERHLASALAADAASVQAAAQTEARQLADALQIQIDAWQAAVEAADATTAALSRVTRAWELGEVGFTELALAQRSAYDARAAELVARLDAHSTRLRIEVDSHRLWAHLDSDRHD